MLSIAKGFSTDYLTKNVAVGGENYYASAVEHGTDPPGQWYGTGAADLGLVGQVDHDVLEAVYSRLQDPRDPAATLGAPHRAFRSAAEIHRGSLAAEPHATPERREQLWGEAQAKARQAVSFVDLTYSPVKSVTVLAVAFEQAAVDADAAGRPEEAEGWRVHHRAVEEAVMVGARAVVDYMEEVAGYSRGGTHGGGGGHWVDAHRFIVSQWFQRDSRERDPQLHVHQGLLNRVLCDDGRWRSLDTAALYLHRPAAGAIGERATEEHLSRTLGARFETRPDGKAREVVGVDQAVMDMFSSRARAVGPKTQELIEAYRRATGQEPNALQRYRLSKDAVLLTRPSKSHEGEPLEARLHRWEAQTQAEMGNGLSKVATDVLALRQDAGSPAEFSPADVVERALAKVASTAATWTRSDLLRAVSDCLPGHLGLGQEDVRPLLEQLTDRAMGAAVRLTPEADLSLRPAEYRLADGGDVYARPGSDLFAAHGQIAAERVLRAAAVERGFERVSDGFVDALLSRYAENGRELGPDQAAALRGVMTSGAAVEILTAPAGTGKSFLAGALSDAWQEHGGRVIGLAPSQVAADVMTDEGVLATNIDRWLLSGNDDAYRVGHGDIVIVDEAGMASTTHLVEVHERCARVGAKMLLVGDPRQLGAVGPGGGLADIAERAQGYELAEVRRFDEQWERQASLALRDGDLSSLEEYDRHGRILDAGTEDMAEGKALRAWLADTLTDREALLLVGSNEAAARLSGAARAELVRLGLVPEEGVRLGKDQNIAGVGDLVQARRNEWALATAESRAPINRSAYRVLETRPDGGLVVSPVGVEGKPLDLPASYVQQHLVLGYASTVHAAQGRTVDRTHSVIGGGWNTALAYVGMTRGRESNTAWVVTRSTAEDSPPGQAQEIQPRSGRAVLADVLGRDNQQRTALEEQRQQEELAASTFTSVGQLLDGITRSCAGHTSALLDRLAADGVITGSQRVALAGDEAMGSVERLLRAAELNSMDRGEVLSEALGGRSLATARNPGQTLHYRLKQQLGSLAPVVTSHRDLIPASVEPYHRAWLESRADDADDRRHELAGRVAADPPAWALEALGPLPEDALERAEWEQKAGWAAAYREMAGHESETDPLGPAPPIGLAEKYSIWLTAHDALGLVDRGPEEGQMSDGQLRARVAAYEREKAWAPPAVRDQLGLGNRALAAAETDVALREAHRDAAVPEAEQRVQGLSETLPLLDEVDRARQAWRDEVAETQATAERSRAELLARGVDVDDPSDRVTAAEWLEAHEAEQAASDEVRDVDRLVEDDVTEDVPVNEGGPETLVPDVRDTSAVDPYEDVDRPRDELMPVEDVRSAVARAQEALVELHNRESLTETAEEDLWEPVPEDAAVDEMVLD